jgi:hypothetical protein
MPSTVTITYPPELLPAAEEGDTVEVVVVHPDTLEPTTILRIEGDGDE